MNDTMNLTAFIIDYYAYKLISKEGYDNTVDFIKYRSIETIFTKEYSFNIIRELIWKYRSYLIESSEMNILSLFYNYKIKLLDEEIKILHSRLMKTRSHIDFKLSYDLYNYDKFYNAFSIFSNEIRNDQEENDLFSSIFTISVYANEF